LGKDNSVLKARPPEKKRNAIRLGESRGGFPSPEKTHNQEQTTNEKIKEKKRREFCSSKNILTWHRWEARNSINQEEASRDYMSLGPPKGQKKKTTRNKKRKGGGGGTRNKETCVWSWKTMSRRFVQKRLGGSKKR